MAVFRSSECAVFTWDNDDGVQGVLCSRSGDSIEVTAHWRAKRRSTETLAELLAAGSRELGVTQETVVVVGGNTARASFVDLSMPKIAAADMRGALSFEVSKHCPMPMDDMQWGYRDLGREPDSERHTIRVSFFRRKDWDEWVSAASGVSSGVDMIIPAWAALDPTLSGRSVALGGDDSDILFVAEPNDGRERHMRMNRSGGFAGDTYGIGDEPLKADGMALGPLASLDPEEQQQYAAALIIASYAVSREFIADSRAWLSVPVEMRPRRNLVQKYWTMAAMLYLVFIVGMLLSSDITEKLARKRAIDRDIAVVQADIQKLSGIVMDEDLGKQIETEIAEADIGRVPLTESLAALSTVITKDLWAASLTWDETDVRCELRAALDDPDMLLDIQQSEFLTDVTYRKSLRSDQSVSYIVDMRIVDRDRLTAVYLQPDPDAVPDEPAEPEPDESDPEAQPNRGGEIRSAPLNRVRGSASRSGNSDGPATTRPAPGPPPPPPPPPIPGGQ
jgi:Tfp pilus assembly protein PilN